MIKGIVLTIVGFSPDGTEAEKAAAIEGLAAVIVVLSIVMPVLSVWIFSRYQITRNIHDDNLESLGYVEKGEAPRREGYEAAGGS